jgi:hypothetical protein
MDVVRCSVKCRWLFLLLFIVLFAGCSSILSGSKPTVTISSTATVTMIPTITPTPSPTPQPDPTPEYQPFQALLGKVVAVGPVYVTADSSVPDAALQAAGTILATMLQYRPDIGVTLRGSGAFTVVGSRSQHICDIPYFSQYNTASCDAYGEGGAGGVYTLPITACHEKNLLGESDDPYYRHQSSYSQNICVHELAHTIMNVGLSQDERNRIYDRFLAVQQEGIWQGDYAMTNSMEFWAVMSQFYFWAGPEKTYSAFNHVANGPDELKRYDPATFALLDSIYKGSADLR